MPTLANASKCPNTSYCYRDNIGVCGAGRRYECDFGFEGEGGMCVPYTPPDAPGPNSVVAPSDESLCVGEGEPVCQGEQLTGKSLPLYDACM